MQHELQTNNLNVIGEADASVLVVCDAPNENVFAEGYVMPKRAMEVFYGQAKLAGLQPTDFAFITPCPPLPNEVAGSDSREAKFIKDFHEEFCKLVEKFTHIKLMISLGPLATRQVLNRPVKITKVRGKVQTLEGRDYQLLPFYSPGHVLRRPELAKTFETDFDTLAGIAQNDWKYDDTFTAEDYQYALDMSDWLEDKPKAVSLDIESAGGRWHEPGFRVLTVQLTRKAGQSRVIPLDPKWYGQGLGYRQRAHIVRQLDALLSDPKVQVTGSNLGSDILGLKKATRIKIGNWKHETQQLAHVVDENMREKGLAEVTRRWNPAMAGYSDAFDKKWDKEFMEKVPPAEMLPYGGGDSDASFQNTRILVKLGMADPRNWNCYERIQMPALRMFCDYTELGIRIDKQALRELGVVLKQDLEEKYTSLIERVSPVIKREHAEKGLKFSRADFVNDILFQHPDGLGLMPIVFTKGTRRLPDEKKEPSTSLKDHLPYFEDEASAYSALEHLELEKEEHERRAKEAAEFVHDLIEYQRTRHMLEKYVGQEGGVLIPQRRKNAPPKYTEPTGFWQYLQYGDRLHPSFFLHRAVTGRTASAYPNAQNFPKRGKIAKAFRKIFIPTSGYKFIEVDESQAELRVAAWMAQESNMLRIYREGGDIHEATAAAIVGIPAEEFHAWKGSEESIPKQFQRGHRDSTTLGELYELKRYQAKSVNFGFLFGMGWKKFRAYAKTDYGIDFTEDEAKELRHTFFRLYPGLQVWHEKMREFVRKHGYVRSLHGALRRLPNIYSDDEGVQGECERQAINSPVQRFASDIALMGLSRLWRDADPEILRGVAFIHDAGIIEVKIGHEEEGMQAAKFYMETAPLKEWFHLDAPIPFVADVKLSDGSLADMEEKKVEAVAPDWYNEELDLAA